MTAADAVVARLGAGRVAVPLQHVAEVGRVPALTRVPGAPEWLVGVANWRGRVVPVVDPRALLGAGRGTLGAAARLVVLTTSTGCIALLADAVEGTTTIADEVAPVPGGVDAAADLVTGQLPRPDGPIAVLDVAAVVRLRDALPRSRRSA